MDSVELVKKICAERKIPISKLEKDCKFSNGYIRKLKEGKFPSDRLLVISQYLDLPISYLMTGEIKTEPQEIIINPKDERDIARDLDALMDKIETGEDSPLYYNGEEVDQESKELLRDAIGMSLRHLKIINKEKYNPRKNKK
ncbi:MAG: helix-turn-helix transcriptional regulator [Lachnospiraceae bacterium]|jgi:hypothetical protein|nr:helix-turn-helix transcriptional regulator [Lachnospiraceae bacterium]